MLVHIMLTVFISPLVVLGQDCVSGECSYISHYYELGCEPVHTNGSCCPTSFNCEIPQLPPFVGPSCLVGGTFYKVGEEIATNASCMVSCTCRDYFEGKTEVVCVSVECPEDLEDDPPMPGCYRTYQEGRCCSTGEICNDTSAMANMSTCAYNGTYYNEGELMYLEDVCKRCICTSNFTGPDSETCQTISCGVPYHYNAEVNRGCALVYTDEGKCCPIPEFICPDEVLRSDAAEIVENNGDNSLQCSFGEEKVNLGDVINFYNQDPETECTCSTPPEITCIKYGEFDDSEEDESDNEILMPPPPPLGADIGFPGDGVSCNAQEMVRCEKYTVSYYKEVDAENPNRGNLCCYLNEELSCMQNLGCTEGIFASTYTHIQQQAQGKCDDNYQYIEGCFAEIVPGDDLQYEDLGCFQDNGTSRAIKPLAAEGQGSPVENCYRAAARKGYSVFALQYGGQCFSDQNADMNYNKYGSAPLSNNCDVYGEGLGGDWTNQVFKITAFTAPPPPPPPMSRIGGVGLAPPSYAKCVNVSNNTPHSVKITVSYEDGEGKIYRYATVDANTHHTFTQMDRSSSGSTYKTVIPPTKISVVKSPVEHEAEMDPVEHVIQVTGVHGCISRVITTQQDGGFMFTEENALTLRTNNEIIMEQATTLGGASQQFTLNIIKELWRTDSVSNMVISPLSISTALAMAMAGAHGQTLDEIRLGLQLLNISQPHQAYRNATKKYQNARNYQLDMGNLMFFDTSLNIEDKFREIMVRNYLLKRNSTDTRLGDPVVKLNFSNTPAEAEAFINQVISNETKEKIQTLIPEGSITVDTKLVLANAIYFFGNWVHQFDEKSTRTEKFYPLTGGEQDVKMMFMKEDLNAAFIETLDSDMVQLPYKGGDISMHILVPRERDGITLLQELLGTTDTVDPVLGTGTNLNDMMRSLNAQKVHLYMPKFKIDYGLDIVQTLKTLGMRSMFSDSVADFSGISNSTALYVSGVFHQANIEVDEKGTEAAAATVILFEERIMGPPPYLVRADKPFLFFITDNQSGMVLFTGRVMEPMSPSPK